MRYFTLFICIILENILPLNGVATGREALKILGKL